VATSKRPTLLIANRRRLTSAEGLSAEAHAQLQHIGERYFGPGDVFIGSGNDGRTISFVFISSVLDGDTHAYDLWQYMGNEGMIFRARTTEVVADIRRYDVRCTNRALQKALQDAIERETPSPDPATDGSLTGDRCVGIVPPWGDGDEDEDDEDEDDDDDHHTITKPAANSRPLKAKPTAKVTTAKAMPTAKATTAKAKPTARAKPAAKLAANARPAKLAADAKSAKARTATRRPATARSRNK
jgi:hypothetical protein